MDLVSSANHSVVYHRIFKVSPRRVVPIRLLPSATTLNSTDSDFHRLCAPRLTVQFPLPAPALMRGTLPLPASQSDIDGITSLPAPPPLRVSRRVPAPPLMTAPLALQAALLPGAGVVQILVGLGSHSLIVSIPIGCWPNTSHNSTSPLGWGG